MLGGTKDKRKLIDRNMHLVDSTIKSEKNNSNINLTWEATLNIVADDLTTASYQRLSQTPKKKGEIYPTTPMRAYLYINGMPIVKDYCNKIMEAWSTQDLSEYLTEKFGWKSNTSDLVEWKLSSNLHSNKKFSEKRFITRYAHKILHFLALKSTVISTKICPYCQATNETLQHLLYCHANKEVWEEFYTSMIPQLNKYMIDPVL
eukprot:14349779-Ditylum_brightwellii.AAC.1